MITSADARILILLVRDTLEGSFSGKSSEESLLVVKDRDKERFSRKQGVFVTLHKHDELRGCIGFVEPVYPLYEAVVRAAQAAAFEDPRFAPVAEDELGEIHIEISVMSVPKTLEAGSAEEYPEKISVGRDGLIIRKGFRSGLLLPQVATEYGWSSEEFLEHTCWKAGLPPAAWKSPEATIMTFQAQVFKETAPGGSVVEVM
ncbi:TIGR00296 family protein [Candidatus Woesearchaeota archaeon CG_4_10_14_0_8_um_filter_47_5]|nr:MAG: TIGR00296 family protein [Candidatus Woesearchaeota archaeon CG_4_10_14_0_8_um_filter_47_5]